MARGIQSASTPEGTASLSPWIMMQHPRLKTPPRYRFILGIATTLEVNHLAFEVGNKGGRENAVAIYFSIVILSLSIRPFF